MIASNQGKLRHLIVWDRLVERFGESGESDLPETEAGLGRERRHWMWRDMEERIARSFWRCFRWVEVNLPSKDQIGWREQGLFMRELFGAFFCGSGHPCYVAVIDRRRPFRSRFLEGTGYTMQEDRTTGNDKNWSLREVRELDLGFGMAPIPVEHLVMVRDGAPREVKLYRRERRRMIMAWDGTEGRRLTAEDRVYFCCAPDRFSAEDEKRDLVPSMRTVQDQETGMYRSTTVSLVKFIARRRAIQLLITLHDKHGETVCLASGQRSPEFLFAHYPEDDGLIGPILGFYDG